jgi:hypothetical protein
MGDDIYGKQPHRDDDWIEDDDPDLCSINDGTGPFRVALASLAGSAIIVGAAMLAWAVLS